MQTTGDRADFPAGTADSSDINGPFTEYDALMRERDALIHLRQMLKRKRIELEQSLQKQLDDNEVCPALFIFPSAEALLRATESDRVQSTSITHGVAHQCVHNSAVLSSWSTPIGCGVGATGMTEYQKSLHAHYLMRTMGHAEKLCLCSANQDAVIHTLTTFLPSPMLRRLQLDVPELSEAIVQKISQWEAEGQLECVSLRLYHIKSTLKSLCSLSSLRSLDVSHTTITNEDLSGLQGCHNLVNLHLSSCRGVTDLSPVSRTQALEVVKLTGCRRLVGAGALGRLPSLKELELRDTVVTDKEIRQLSECHTLKKIDFHSCKALTNVNPLSSIATLEVINLSYCTSLTHLGALGRLPVLKEVDLSGTPITDADVRLVSECRTLVRINLNSCSRLTNVNPLSSIATLEVINLSGCTSLTRVGALGKLPVLKELNLSESLITDKDVRLLSECRTLVKIGLHSCKALTNVTPLSSIATLEEINLSYCTSLTHVGALGRLPVLKEVDLRRTPITDEDVRFLRECRTLVKIDLTSCKTLRNVTPLSSIATLEVINLSWCTFLTHLSALGRFPVPKEVYLRGTPITDEDVRQLSECQTLLKIDLMECKTLTNVNPLSSIATLEAINLSGCSSLTRVGALGRLPVLKEVYLSGTPITDEEMRLLSECQTLVKIDLSYCHKLTNVNPLSSIATLEAMDLSYCIALTHVGALGKLPFLKGVNLTRAPVTEEELSSLGSLRKQLGLPPIDIEI